MTSFGAHKILSSDPEVIAIQGMLHALTHFGRKHLTLRHLKVMMGVELMCKVTNGRAHPRATDVAGLIGVPHTEFESELRDLVEYRYLHELMPTFGPLIMTYKLGSMGGTVMRQMLAAGKLKPGGALPEEGMLPPIPVE